MPYNIPPPAPNAPPKSAGGGSLAAEGAVMRQKECVRLVVGPGSAVGGQHSNPGRGGFGA